VKLFGQIAKTTLQKSSEKCLKNELNFKHFSQDSKGRHPRFHREIGDFWAEKFFYLRYAKFIITLGRFLRNTTLEHKLRTGSDFKRTCFRWGFGEDGISAAQMGGKTYEFLLDPPIVITKKRCVLFNYADNSLHLLKMACSSLRCRGKGF
jgi:hypothetical protein